MKTSVRTRWILSFAAAVTLGSLGSATFAQQRVNNGNVRDANNRIGSGGVNAGGNQNKSIYGGVTANDIVYGNVTGGMGFRGPLGSTDPRAFRGPTGSGVSDSFVRSSGGSPLGVYGPYQSNATTVRPYYGDSRWTAPPEGFVSQGVVGGYIPSATVARQGQDLRIGDPLGINAVAPIRPGQLMLPGPVDNSNSTTIITASPLYGVRQWSNNMLSDQQFMSRFTLYGSQGRSMMDQQMIDRMRKELSDPTQADPDAVKDPNLAQPLDKPADAPSDQALTLDPLSATGSTGAMYQQRINLLPADKQSAVYAQLQQRLRTYDSKGLGLSAAKKANLEYNETLRAKKQIMENAAKEKQPKAPQPGVTPGATPPGAQQPGATPSDTGMTPGATPGAAPGTAIPGVTDSGAPTGNNAVLGPTGTKSTKPKPVQIPSLVTGVQAKGLAEVLQKAETLMKEGKWVSALSEYDNARQIAPNQPLVLIGRANAELGATYYARAEADIRAAFTADPALLGGQYDLRAMIGDDRLSVIVKELKEIANRDKKVARPVFLLAYIAYNTGSERMASGYLDLAEKRAGGGDTFYAMVREHWVFPDDGAPANPEDLNK